MKPMSESLCYASKKNEVAQLTLFVFFMEMFILFSFFHLCPWKRPCACLPAFVREAMGVVLHKDSKWYQQWKDFKDNNMVFNRKKQLSSGSRALAVSGGAI